MNHGWSLRVLVLVIALTGMLPASAGAVAPADLMVEIDGRQAYAEWTPGPESVPYVAEAAIASATNADGGFQDTNLVLSEVISGRGGMTPDGLRWFYLSESPLPPGTYYFHVSTRSFVPDPQCPVGVDQPCLLEWSATQIVEVPAAVPPGLLTLGHTNGRMHASWHLGIDMDAFAFEVSPNPALDLDGFFADPDPPIFESLLPHVTSFTGSTALPPGTYYAHVGALSRVPDFECNPVGQPCWELLWSPVGGFTISTAVATALPTSPTPPKDTAVTFSRLRVSSAQRFRRLAVTVSIAERGRIKVTGLVNVPGGGSKVFRYKPVSLNVAAGTKVTLKPELPRSAARAVRKALRRGKRLTARLTITATDHAGNSIAAKKSVRLKR